MKVILLGDTLIPPNTKQGIEEKAFDVQGPHKTDDYYTLELLEKDLQRDDILFVIATDFVPDFDEYLRFLQKIVQTASGANRVLCILGTGINEEYIGEIISLVSANYLKGHVTPLEIALRLEYITRDFGQNDANAADASNTASQNETRQTWSFPNLSHDDDNFWKKLINTIKAGRLVPVIGPYVTDPPIPTSETITQLLMERIQYPFPNNVDLSTVTHWARLVNYYSHDGFADIINSYIEMQRAKKGANDPLKLLATIPFPGYITTNYDNELFYALRNIENRNPIRLLYDWNPTLGASNSFSLEENSRSNHEDKTHYDEPITLKQLIEKYNTEQSLDPAKRFYFRYRDFQLQHPSIATAGSKAQYPFILYLHGNTDQCESMVITELDYVQFLLNAGNEANRLDIPVKSPRFLFIGYRLSDWGFRFSFRSLFYERDRGPDFILHEKNRKRSGDLLDQSINVGQYDPAYDTHGLEKYFDNMGIRTLWYEEPTKFLEKLIERFEESK